MQSSLGDLYGPATQQAQTPIAPVQAPGQPPVMNPFALQPTPVTPAPHPIDAQRMQLALNLGGSPQGQQGLFTY